MHRDAQHDVPRRSLPRTIARTAALMALAACGDAAAPAAPAAPPRFILWSVVPREQVGLAGADATPPVVVATDSSGNLAANVTVRFTVRDGEGNIESPQVIADGTGHASAGRWVLGPGLGLQRVRAEVVGEPESAIEFITTAIPVEGPMRFDGRCSPPDSLLPLGWSLPKTAERLARREPLTVVAIGSSSTQGIGASVPDSAYPALLARHLHRLYPASAVTVYNAGRSSQQLDQLQARFESDVFARDTQLVILQTGTIDARNGVPLATVEARLRDAIDTIQAAGAEVILLDSQRYPGFGESTTYRAFQVTMRRVAEERGIPLVRRYVLLSHWIETGF